jgi:hypothetical protein
MIEGTLETAGERVALECAPDWVASLIDESAAGELRRAQAPDASLHVRVEADRSPFDVRGWELFARGAWRRPGQVVLENACGAGFDLCVTCAHDRANFVYRWRPPTQQRAAAYLLRSRFHLLARAVLVQYPALWWAGTRGRAPLHASVATAGASAPLLTSPSGVGRSTVVLREAQSGGRSTGDNLSVGDGSEVWGLVEPLRVEGGSGRRMPHGRREAALPGRVDSLVPDSLVVLRRGTAAEPRLVDCGPKAAVRALVTSTYMAGELRRYWAFAATLAAGTEIGPAHPPVTSVASAFAAQLPCYVLLFARSRGVGLSELLPAAREGAAACL